VRNQGARGTCVAFAVVSLLEHHYGPKKGPLDLAEQYLFWAAKESPHDHDSKDDGTTLRCAMDALMHHGVCTETHWPYEPRQNRRSVTHGPPPDDAHEDAKDRVHPKLRYEASLRNNADVLHGLLAQGRPVAITLPVFKDKLTSRRHNWNNDFAERSGRIFDPPPGAVATLGHAVCVVAFIPDATAKGDGWFVFRNSWGPGWGDDTSAGPSRHPGYGYVSAAYVQDHGWELLAL
jgi:C1A family cysteine protease